jgi:hypothetical protein
MSGGEIAQVLDHGGIRNLSWVPLASSRRVQTGCPVWTDAQNWRRNPLIPDVPHRFEYPSFHAAKVRNVSNVGSQNISFILNVSPKLKDEQRILGTQDSGQRQERPQEHQRTA